MRILAFLLIVFILNCQSKVVRNDNYKNNNVMYNYQIDDTELNFKFLDKNQIQFNLSVDEIGLKNFKEVAKLVLIEDIDGKLIVPEGTNCIDYNNPKDIIGVKCDSTYSYNNDTLSLAIAIENGNHKRLDLQLEMRGKIKHSISKTLISSHN